MIHHEFITRRELTCPAVHRASPCHIYKVLRIKMLPHVYTHTHTHSWSPLKDHKRI